MITRLFHTRNVLSQTFGRTSQHGPADPTHRAPLQTFVHAPRKRRASHRLPGEDTSRNTATPQRDNLDFFFEKKRNSTMKSTMWDVHMLLCGSYRSMALEYAMNVSLFFGFSHHSSSPLISSAFSGLLPLKAKYLAANSSDL